MTQEQIIQPNEQEQIINQDEQNIAGAAVQNQPAPAADVLEPDAESAAAETENAAAEESGQEQQQPEQDGAQQPQPDLQPASQPDFIAPTRRFDSGMGSAEEKDGHKFVQLVRIAEQLEADGFNPVKVRRIDEVLRPLTMHYPERSNQQDEEREHLGKRSDSEEVFAPRNEPPLVLASLPALNHEDAQSPEGVKLELDKLFQDPEGEPLTYSISNLPPGLSFNPKTGEITGTIDKSASQGGSNGIYKVTVTATDPKGASSEQTFTWTVTNPDPEAEDDVGETFKTQRLIKDAESGLLANDSDPDGDKIFVQDVTGKDGKVSVNSNGDTEVKGEYGTLVVKPDGSYTYTPDLSDKTGDVWKLPEGGTRTDTFTYTVSDGEGGIATAELKIEIKGHSNTPPFLTVEDKNGADVDGQVTVHEKGLAGGSEPGEGHTASGVINVHAMDGLKYITIGTKTITLAELKDLGSGNTITINVDGGEITLTGFDPFDVEFVGEATQTLGGEIYYTYTLGTQQTHGKADGNNLLLDVQLRVVDDQDGSSDNKLTINVIDDVPEARDDVNAITEDATDPVTGNVIGGGDAADGDEADTTGADGATVTAITSENVTDNDASDDGSGVLTIVGQYGTLTIHPNGDYTYELDNSNLDVQGLHPDDTPLTDVFNYTLTDNDGDAADATLTINIHGQDDGVTITVPDPNDPDAYPEVDPDDPTDPALSDTNDLVVFERGLPTGSDGDGTNAVENLTKVESSFTISALDGLADTDALILSVGSAELTLGKDAIEALNDTSSNILNTDYGELVLTGYELNADGTITIDYEYTLTSAPNNANPEHDDDYAFDRITIQVNDRDTDLDSQTLSIKIIDDAPTAKDDENSVTEGAGIDDTSSVARGNVLGRTGGVTEPSDDDVADTAGADGAAVTEIVSNNVAGNDATADAGGVLTIDGQYGTLTIQPDGSYTYKLDNNNLDVQGLIEGETLTETFKYTIKDGDDDSASAELVITINGADDGVTVTVPDPADPKDYPVEDPDNNPDNPTWGGIDDHVVFESGLVGGSQNSSNTAVNDLVMVKSSFTFSALDGLADTDAIVLSVAGNELKLSKADVEALSSTDTKIITTKYGELVLNGYSQAADGTITIDYEYTLTKAPENTAAGDSSDADKFTDDTIKITVNDRDLTPDTATEDLVIRIMDDVPGVSVTTDLPDKLVVSEADMTLSATGDFKDAFEHHFGADGEGSFVYSLAIDNTATGLAKLKDTLTGESIKLVLDADGTVKGVVDNEGGTDNGETIFTVTVDSDGKVTLTQARAMHHENPQKTGSDDVLTLPAGSIKLTATVTDKDGDTDTASVDIGDKLTFQDDGPSLDDTKIDGGFVSDNAIVDEKYLPSGSEYTDGTQLVVSKDLPIDFGADGAVASDGTTGLTFNQSNLTALDNLNLKSSTTGLAYTLSTDGRTITATRGEGGNDIFTIKLKVAANGTPSYEFTLKGPLDHNLQKDEGTGKYSADKIELPFDITATDGDGDSVSLKFKVEVVDDTPETADLEQTVDEDGSISFSNADINTTTTKVNEDAKPKHGEVIIGDDGTVTYKPFEDYRGSDSYTYTVTTGGVSYERKVDVTVKPVADKPLFADKDGNYPENTAVEPDGTLNTGTYDYSVQTNEDVSVGLRLHVPKVKDDGTAKENNETSELLGAITLTPTGTGYSAGASFTTGGKDLAPKDGKITIVITGNSGSAEPLDGYHVKGEINLVPAKDEDNGVYYLTKEEYEAITAHPAADRHENFKVEVSVDSYEVGADGKKLTDVNGANSKQTITVDVHAVTDPVGLQVKEGDAQTGVTVSITQDAEGKNKTADITFNEDTSFNLTNILEPAAFKDLDGSETRSLTVEGLPVGTVINVGGTPYTIDSTGTATLEIAGDVAHDALPQITVTPPKDFSGDLTDIKVILGAKDSDADSPAATPTTVTDEVTINLHVKPVAGDVAAGNVETKEDTAVAFLDKVRVTDTGTEHGTEVIDSVAFKIPDGWSMTNSTVSNAAEWTIAESGGTHTITFTSGTEAEREAVLKGFMIKPPAHSSKDATIELTITSTDTNSTTGSNTKTVTSADKPSLAVTVKVTPVAERTDTDSDDAGGNDVTMNGNHVYQTSGEEDKWFVLGNETSASFKLSAGWSNEDGKWVFNDDENKWEDVTSTDISGRSEDTFALLTPYMTKNNDARHDSVNPNENLEGMLEGSVFTYIDGDGETITLPFAGEPVKIPMQYLDSVQFKGPEDWSGVVKIKVQAGTIDYDEDDGSATELEESGESWLTNLIIEPRADQVTLKVDTPIKTLEDTPVKLNIVPTSSDKNETFDVTISGIPKGATVKYWENGVEKTFTATTDSSSLSIANFDKTKQPELTPPQDSNEPINLTVKAESVDTLTYINDEGKTVVVEHKGTTKTTKVYGNGADQDPTSTTTDTVGSDTSYELPINVEVQGVPDTPILKLAQDYDEENNQLDSSVERNYKTYEEDNDNVGTLEVALSDLVTEMESGEIGVEGTEENPQPDDSETITLRISDLPEGFTLTGAGPQLGGSGESRVWVISESQLNDVKIIVPANYSGTVDFTVQPVVTENDNPSEVFFEKQNVSFKVKPVAEASLSVSSNLLEDIIGQLSLTAVGADTDEYISEVRISADEVANKGLTLHAADGALLTPDGGYYTFTYDGLNSQKAPDVYVKGPANYSGDIKLNIGYTVTDPVADGTIDPATKEGTVEHTLNFAPVTDKIKLTLGGIDGGATVEGVTTQTNPGSIKVKLNVVQTGVQVGKEEGDTVTTDPDTDNSEQLTHILITGVPAGVSVKGAVETATGQWLMTIDSKKWNGNAILEHELEFVVSGYAAPFTGQTITITTYSKDTGATAYEKDSVEWQLTYTRDGEEDSNDLPNVSLDALDNLVEQEDGPFSLGTVVTGEIDAATAGTSDYNVTLTIRTKEGDDTTFDGMIATQVVENDESITLWTKTEKVSAGQSGQEKLEQMLNEIKVNTPKDANSNNLPGGKLDLDINLSVHADGISRDDSAKPEVVITPVTDDITIGVSTNIEDEGTDVALNIMLPTNTVDGDLGAAAGWTIVDDKVYIHVADGTLEGQLTDADGNALTVHSGARPDGTPTGGKLYAVDADKLAGLKFVPDATKPHQTGKLDITVLVKNQEQGAGNIEVSIGTGSVEIQQSNSGYKATISAVGEELQGKPDDELIKLNITDQGLVDDKETIDSAFISGLPDGFTVWVGEPATMASNAGGGTWAIPLEANNLPANISIKPPKNWSGTLEGLKLTVMSGHAGLTPTASDISFDLVVNPVANGIEMNPTLSFGDAGDKIELNLNASMKDPSAATGAKDEEGKLTDQYTELTELSLSGFPDGQKVQFFIGDSEVPLDGSQATFDGSTWTITGLSQSDLQNLKFLHGEGSADITVKGRTYEVNAAGEQYKESGVPQYSDWSDAKTAAINISPTVPTSGADHFLWDGTAINGFGGEDTVQLRFGDNLNTTDFSKMENIEIIDMSGEASGANTITGLTAEDVFNMTDENNILKILGDGEDIVGLGGEWGAGERKGDFTTYTATFGVETVKLEIANAIVD